MMQIRNSNFEYLRIVAMLMVILSHFFVHSGFTIHEGNLLKDVLINSLKIGEIGVACFVLISGYFLIDLQFDIRKLFKLVFQMWFYGVFILLFAHIAGTSAITSKYFWGSVLPFYSLNWFAKAYLLLYMLFPIINHVLKRTSKKNLEKFIIIFGILWTVFPIYNLYAGGNVRITVIFIYIIGAYLKMYGAPLVDKHRKALLLGSMIAVFSSSATFVHLGGKYDCFVGRESSFLSLNSIFVITVGLCTFFYFKELKVKNSRIVNMIAKTVFGIYLIHDNPMLNGWIWRDIFQAKNHYDSAFIFPYAVFCVVVIFVICSIIDYGRIIFVENPVLKYVDSKGWFRNLDNKIRLLLK